MSFADELNLLLAKSGKTQAQVAEDLGVSRQAVQFWASGRSEPKGSNLAKFRQYESEWGIGNGVSYPNVVFHPEDAAIPEGYSQVKCYKLAFAANPGTGDECETQWEPDESEPPSLLPDSFFRKHRTTPERCKKAFVIGDSMEPFIYAGDKIIFIDDPIKLVPYVAIHDGSIYCLSVKGFLKIKRVHSIKNGIELISDNERYSPEEYVGNECEMVRIYGKVIHIERSLR